MIEKNEVAGEEVLKDFFKEVGMKARVMLNLKGFALCLIWEGLTFSQAPGRAGVVARCCGCRRAWY